MYGWWLLHLHMMTRGSTSARAAYRPKTYSEPRVAEPADERQPLLRTKRDERDDLYLVSPTQAPAAAAAAPLVDVTC